MTYYVNATRGKNIAVWGWWGRNDIAHNLGDVWILSCIKSKFPGIIPITTHEKNFSQYDFVIIGEGGLLNGPMLRSPFDIIHI